MGSFAFLSQLNIMADVKNVFQHAFNKGQFQMVGIVRVAEAEDRSLIMLVDWGGFEVEERTREPFESIFEAAPEFLEKEVRKLRVTRAIKARITSEFACDLLIILAFFLCIKLVARFSVNALWGRCDEISPT